MSRVSLYWWGRSKNSHGVFPCVFNVYLPLSFFLYLFYISFSLLRTCTFHYFLYSLFFTVYICQFPSSSFSLLLLYFYLLYSFFSPSCIQFLEVYICPFHFPFFSSFFSLLYFLLSLFFPIFLILPLLYYPLPPMAYFFSTVISVFFSSLVYSFFLLYSTPCTIYIFFNNSVFSASPLI